MRFLVHPSLEVQVHNMHSRFELSCCLVNGSPGSRHVGLWTQLLSRCMEAQAQGIWGIEPSCCLVYGSPDSPHLGLWTQLLSGVWKPMLTASGALNPAVSASPESVGDALDFRLQQFFKPWNPAYPSFKCRAQAPEEAAYELGFILGPGNSCLVGLACTFIIWALEALSSWLEHGLSSFGPWNPCVRTYTFAHVYNSLNLAQNNSRQLCTQAWNEFVLHIEQMFCRSSF